MLLTIINSSIQRTQVNDKKKGLYLKQIIFVVFYHGVNLQSEYVLYMHGQ